MGLGMPLEDTERKQNGSDHAKPPPECALCRAGRQSKKHEIDVAAERDELSSDTRLADRPCVHLVGLCIGMCIDMSINMCMNMRWACATHRWKALVEALLNENRHACTRGLGMPVPAG